MAAAMLDSGSNSNKLKKREFSPYETLARLDSREPFNLPLALELQSRRLVGLQLLDVQKHHPHKALSTGSPIPSPTHSPSIFYQTLLFPLLHNSSTEPLLAPTGELVPWPSSCPPFRVNEDITRLNVYLISVAQNRMYHSILKAFRVENNKDVKWYVMADDDTLIFVDNLVELRGKYDHTKYYYIGTNSESIH
ncbi:hypothetical protein WN944_026623 [Citrus x changshan-huyou]|uniref:Fringe-like glycosyltransferase domain-containing protein n=1 Tax=Citrus x changshan-huyou TaxID=2935761 RepID=A0AAP0QDF4_9ROSI